jgi:hypothetical protein
MLKFLKSTETALNHVITHVEETVENREFILQAFLDIKRVCDSTLFDIITKAAKRHGLGEGPVCKAQVHWEHKGSNPVANHSINQWAWRHNLLADWLYAGWQENYGHTCRRNYGGVCD